MESLQALGLASGQGPQEGQSNVAQYEVFLGAGVDATQTEAARLLALEHATWRSAGRIWQREPFLLASSFEETPSWAGSQQAEAGAYLWGSTSFGDNVEDEWFTVALLLELTLKLPGSTARVSDNDGEFLLIEAAYALPKWLKPDTAANRVWLRAGELHLVPFPSAAAPSLPPAPTIWEALQVVAAASVDTRGSKGVQAAALDRTRPFADGGAPPMHCAHVTVPACVAQLLAREPQLLAPAVEAFYFRDAAAMKAAGRMAHVPPKDLVTTTATFNRCLYAQLKQQAFQPPPAFSLPPEGSPAFPAAELGAKLTCGFEMLLACGRPSPSSAPLPPLAVPDIDSPAWHAFTAAASRGPSDATSSAAAPADPEHRRTAIVAYQQAADSLARPVDHVERLLQEPVDVARFSGAPPPADSDAWLADSSAELEAELQRSAVGAGPVAGGPTSACTDDAATGPEAQLDQISRRMQAFLQEQSGHEGADSAAAADAAGADDIAGLDASSFLQQLSSILGAGASGAADDESDESSGFYDDEDSGSSSSDDEADAAAAAHPAARASGAQPAAAQRRGNVAADVQTDTDSDDADAEFMAEYSDALEAQLQGTYMGGTFARVGDDGSAAAAAARGPPAQARDVAQERQAEEGVDTEPLQPVDLDLNLVSSLLESFASQQGLPGPASNLAGMLGVPLSRLPKPPDR